MKLKLNTGINYCQDKTVQKLLFILQLESFSYNIYRHIYFDSFVAVNEVNIRTRKKNM